MVDVVARIMSLKPMQTISCHSVRFEVITLCTEYPNIILCSYQKMDCVFKNSSLPAVCPTGSKMPCASESSSLLLPLYGYFHMLDLVSPSCTHDSDTTRTLSIAFPFLSIFFLLRRRSFSWYASNGSMERPEIKLIGTELSSTCFANIARRM